MPPLACRITIFSALLGLVACAPGEADDRYVAWLSDGTRLTAGSLPQWPVPGIPSRFENRDLLSASNPLRLMRDRRASVSRKPPLLVLANGDVLSGVPTALEPDLGRVGHMPRVKVQL